MNIPRIIEEIPQEGFKCPNCDFQCTYTYKFEGELKYYDLCPVCFVDRLLKIQDGGE